MIESGQAHELGRQLMVRNVVSAPLDSPGQGAHFLDAAALCAAVTGPKMHDDTVRFDDPLQFVRYLLGYALLYCKPARIFAHNAREFRESNDLLMTQAPDIGLTDKRQNMVLAQRSEIDRPSTICTVGMSWAQLTHSRLNTTSMLGSPLYPSVISTSAWTQRRGVRLHGSLSRSMPKRLKISAM